MSPNIWHWMISIFIATFNLHSSESWQIMCSHHLKKNKIFLNIFHLLCLNILWCLSRREIASKWASCWREIVCGATPLAFGGFAPPHHSHYSLTPANEKSLGVDGIAKLSLHFRAEKARIYVHAASKIPTSSIRAFKWN